MGKCLGYIMTGAASSNSEMAHGLGIQESIVSRSVKELTEKGVIVKETSGTRSAYTIVDHIGNELPAPCGASTANEKVVPVAVFFRLQMGREAIFKLAPDYTTVNV